MRSSDASASGSGTSPRPDVDGPSKAWNGIVDLALATLTTLDLSAFSTDVGARAASVANGQTREVVAGEAALHTGRRVVGIEVVITE